MAHGDADSGQLTPRSTFYDTGRFGRLFPALPPFSADVPLIRDALSELGAAGGPMDAQDDLSDPVTLITDPAKSAHNPNNPTLTAGFTFLGQFLDHDMTFDPTSSLARAQDPESIRNFRIPALDLDSVYGGGPGVSPFLYDQSVDDGRTTFLTEEIPGSGAVSIDGSTRRDLPRNSQSADKPGICSSRISVRFWLRPPPDFALCHLMNPISRRRAILEVAPYSVPSSASSRRWRRCAISSLWLPPRPSPRAPPGTVTKRLPRTIQLLLFRWER